MLGGGGGLARCRSTIARGSPDEISELSLGTLCGGEQRNSACRCLSGTGEGSVCSSRDVAELLVMLPESWATGKPAFNDTSVGHFSFRFWLKSQK